MSAPRTQIRLSRELALRLLFQHHSSGQRRPQESVRLFEQSFSPEFDAETSLGLSEEIFKAAWPKAVSLFLGTAGIIDELDSLISGASENWSLERMSPVDLSLMRLALYEMRYKRVPPKVCLNEAIEMAKDYGNQDSAAFVNGVLDKLLKSQEAKSL